MKQLKLINLTPTSASEPGLTKLATVQLPQARNVNPQGDSPAGTKQPVQEPKAERLQVEYPHIPRGSWPRPRPYQASEDTTDIREKKRNVRREKQAALLAQHEAERDELKADAEAAQSTAHAARVKARKAEAILLAEKAGEQFARYIAQTAQASVAPARETAQAAVEQATVADLSQPVDFALQVQAEDLWPSDKRVMYCTLTGQPWGQVTEQYIQQLITAYSFEEYGEFDEYIRNRWMIAGPAPLWQGFTTEHLRRNKELDPVGFLVYMIRYTLQIDKVIEAVNKRSHRASGGASATEILYQFQQAQARLYRDLTVVDKGQIAVCNETLLLMSTEGKLPTRNQMPSTDLDWYGDAENLEKFLRKLKRIYSRRRAKAVITTTDNRRLGPNEMHGRVSRGNLHVEDKSVPEQEHAVKQMLNGLFALIEDNFSDAERKAAKAEHGIASGLHALLRDIDAEAKAEHKAAVQDIKELAALEANDTQRRKVIEREVRKMHDEKRVVRARVIKPGQKITIPGVG